ncbi:MAG: hypothetical protein DRP70_09715 [Spirochaetes bacterium]|nr:MAG: hypothetical protein DRP70_09715 [Spirochaetota bacterium]RKX93722.1 MAG: hypothetical protein DRZ90_12540 [Spirochaetota bacterium]
MARPRKNLKYADLLSPLSITDLKLLKDEVSTEIRVKGTELKKAESEEAALKIRDKIRIGSKITFNEKATGGKSIKAQVIGIFADKVQVEVGGRRRSVALVRVSNVD